jgi:hypothetical protein
MENEVKGRNFSLWNKYSRIEIKGTISQFESQFSQDRKNKLLAEYYELLDEDQINFKS